MDSNNNGMKRRMNILQWNAHSLNNKLKDFELLLCREQVHIALVSETWMNPATQIRVSNYNILRDDREDNYGGLCIIAHKTVKMCQSPFISPNTDIQIMIVKIYNVPDLENIVLIYCPPTCVTTQSDWDVIFQPFDSKTLIAGDVNGHHLLWSNRNDTRGKLIYNAMFENNFVCLNNGQATRMLYVNGFLQNSSPDVTFVTPDLAIKANWMITNESLNSDHLVLNIKFNYDSFKPINKKRNLKEANWEEYTKKINKQFDTLSLPLEVQSGYNEFMRKVNLVADETIPWIKYCQEPNCKFSPKPYWNSELSKMIAERRKALAQLRRNPTPDNYKLYISKVKVARQSIRKARISSWKSFCTSIECETSPTVVWQKMRWIKGQRTPHQIISPEKAVQLLESLTPDNACEPPPTFHFDESNILNKELTLCELDNSLRKRDTTPGIDNCSYSMLFNLPRSAKLYLLHIFNLIMCTGSVPIQWRYIRLLPITKPGRDPQLLSSFRPIALMSCVCKTFHWLLMKRLEWFTEKNNLFSPATTGFRRGKSCLCNLTKLVTEIEKGFSKRKSTIACFIDIDNAYNNIRIVALVEILKRIGIGDRIIKYLWSFLTERYLKIETSYKINICRRTITGLGQGDPLSPILFNISTLDVCKNINNVLIQQYADDFVLYKTVNSDMNQTVKDLQYALNVLIKLLEKIGLCISESKSNVCLFNRSRKIINFSLYINAVALRNVHHVKYLGLWLDSKLLWGIHINKICEKVYKYLNILKILAGCSWGIHQNHMRKLYIALIRSRIDYGSFLYGGCAKSHQKKIELLQNNALRVCGGFIRTTPIHVMQNELCIPPLHIRRYWLACRFWLNAAATLKETIKEINELALICHERYWNKKIKPILTEVHNYLKDENIHSSEILEVFTLETWISSIDVNSCVSTDIDNYNAPKRMMNVSHINQLVTIFLDTKYPGFYKIFTDGSKDLYGVGAAFFDPQENCSIKFKLPTELCIMHAELCAIAESLAYINSIYNQNTNILILTDSKSALQHLVRSVYFGRGMPIAYQILGLIYQYHTSNIKVILQWIPSHVGICGNDMADRFARDAVTEGVVLRCKPTASELLTIARKKCLSLWDKYYEEKSLDKGIWYKIAQPRPPRKPWFDSAGLPRNILTWALRIRSGHIPLNYFLHLIGRRTSPLCDYCEKTEDIIHLLMECSQTVELRKKFELDNINDIVEINLILMEPRSERAQNLYLFTKEYLKTKN